MPEEAWKIWNHLTQEWEPEHVVRSRYLKELDERIAKAESEPKPSQWITLPLDHPSRASHS